MLTVHDEKNKRILKLEKRKLDAEAAYQKQKEFENDMSRPSLEFRNKQSQVTSVEQSNEPQIALVQNENVDQHQYQQILEVPPSHIQHINVNQMSQFLQVNNPPGQIRYPH